MGSTLVRIDKNFAFNILDFEKFDSSRILKDLVFYISFSFQSDLFGYGTLDPKKFSETMSLDYANLFRKHPDPFQVSISRERYEKLLENEKKHGQFSEYRLWDSYLDNALFILKTIPVITHYKSPDKDHYEENNFIILETVAISKTTVRGQTKILYKYKLNKTFVTNLKKFFLNTNLQAYIALKKSNLDSIFVSISNIIQVKNSQGRNRHVFDFDELRQLLHISENYEARFVKTRINQKMKTIQADLLKEYPGFNFYWHKTKNQRYAYTPYITWELQSSNALKEINTQIYQQIFKNDLKRQLLDFFRFQRFDDYIMSELPLEDEEIRFLKWLISDDDDKHKKAIYITVYGIYNKVSRFIQPDYKADEFIKGLKNFNVDDQKFVRIKDRIIEYINNN